MRWTLFHSSVRFNKPICMRPSQAADSRTVDGNHIGNSLGLAESKRLSEVCYQPAAGLQILYQRKRQILVSVRRAQALICRSCKTSLTLNVLRRPARPLFPLLLSLVGGTPCCFLPKCYLKWIFHEHISKKSGRTACFGSCLVSLSLSPFR